VRIKLDENLGQKAAELLRNAGHEVHTVANEQLCGTSDHDLIDICKKERRCLVTLDLDFSNPLLFAPWRYAGIAVLRLPVRPEMHDIIGCIRTLIHGLEQEPIRGKLWIIQRGRIRAYQPDS